MSQRAQIRTATDADESESTKSDWLAHRLEELILSGELRPGTVLRQEDISHRFGVSRTPVREAFRQLMTLGLVSFSPNRGVRVRTIDRDEWRQASLARAALEGLLAELAAPNIDDAVLSQLDQTAAEFERCTGLLRSGLAGEERDRVAFDWVEANQAFHAVIATAAAAPYIETIVSNVSRVFSGHTRWTPGSTADQLYAIDVRQHRAIREALAVGNARAARVLAHDHVIESWQLLEQILDEVEATVTPTK